MLYASTEIANWFLVKFSKEHSDVTPMKLMKLVYLTHGWYYYLSGGKPLISEDVQAWEFGPVFPELYHRTKRYGSGFVTDCIETYNSEKKTTEYITVSKSNEQLIKLLERIWEVYSEVPNENLNGYIRGKDSAWQLTWDEMKEIGMTQSRIDPERIIEQFRKFSIIGEINNILNT